MSDFWVSFVIAFAIVATALVVLYVVTGATVLWVAGFVALGVSGLVLALTHGGDDA